MKSLILKTTVTAATMGLSLAMSCIAQNLDFNCIVKKNADWHDPSSWQNEVVPSEGMLAIINGGLSSFVEKPFDAWIIVQVSNGTSEPPDGTLTINADFHVKSLAVAVHNQTSGRVEQNDGVVSVEELSLASSVPEAIYGTYDLNGGKLETDILKAGMAGPGNLNLNKPGEVVTVRQKLALGGLGTLRFTGGKEGFPTLNAMTADTIIDPGAAITVEAGGPETKSGKFTLIQADQPLATKFKVELVGFAAGKAKLLESEQGVVLEVR